MCVMSIENDNQLINDRISCVVLRCIQCCFSCNSLNTFFFALNTIGHYSKSLLKLKTFKKFISALSAIKKCAKTKEILVLAIFS